MDWLFLSQNTHRENRVTMNPLIGVRLSHSNQKALKEVQSLAAYCYISRNASVITSNNIPCIVADAIHWHRPQSNNDTCRYGISCNFSLNNLYILSAYLTFTFILSVPFGLSTMGPWIDLVVGFGSKNRSSIPWYWLAGGNVNSAPAALLVTYM